MNALLGLIVVTGAALGARRLASASGVGSLAGVLVWSTAFVGLLLAAFYLQGFAELATHRPLIALPATALIVVAFWSAILVATRFTAATPAAASASIASRASWRPIPRSVAVLLALVFTLLAILLVAGWPRGYEVRAYHLPIAVRILRDGTLGLWDSAYMHSFPANMSIWAGFFLALLPEHLVTLFNLPLLALLCVALYALGRAVGGDRSASLLIAAGVTTIPIFGFSALELGADIGGVAFTAVAAYFVIARPGSPVASSLVAGVAAGIAFGFKSLNLVPVGALGLCLVVDAWHRGQRGRIDGAARWHAFAPVLVYTAGALAMMSFWLCRNLVEAGNPLYPVHLGPLSDLLGWRAAPDFDLQARAQYEHEWVRTRGDWLVYPWVEGQAIDQNFKHSSGLGAFFAATVPIVMVLWPIQRIVALRQRAASTPWRAQTMLYASALTVFVAWWGLGDRQPRYVMTGIVLFLPLASDLLTRTRGALRVAYETLLSIGMLSMALVLLVRVAVDNGPLLLLYRGAPRHQALEYPASIDHLPPGAVVANGVDRAVSYLLLGEGLHNKVVDLAEVERRFSTDQREGGDLRFDRAGVAALGITHLYVEARRHVILDRCVGLQEVDRLDRNPFNGHLLESARVLYAVVPTCDD